ncbi:DUF4190 domain-containing protein [uncultured Agrococcus sp.]|uniref:DUF4190 domain-containing protein n=1 Tax=uncultured Agrococcus sp. TaxID=382258 RepID=UPI0025E77A3E|nr:DUF4190 domain-containing protein [uncultured Agrococcus sp.]
MTTSQQQNQSTGLSLTSMILGIVSLFFGWTFLVPIIGLILGFMGLKREPRGKGLAITGLILNGLCVIGWVIATIILLTVGGAFFGAFLFV